MTKRSPVALPETCQIEPFNLRRGSFNKKLQILLQFLDIIETICDLEMITVD